MDIAERLQQLLFTPRNPSWDSHPAGAPIRDQMADELRRAGFNRQGTIVPVNANGFPLGGGAAPAQPSLSERLVNYLNSVLPRPQQVEAAIMPRAEAWGQAGADMRQRFGRGVSDAMAGALEARAAGKGP